MCPCSPDIGDCPRCKRVQNGGGSPSHMGKKKVLEALDFVLQLPLESGFPTSVRGTDVLEVLDRLLAEGRKERKSRRSTRRDSRKRQQSLQQQKQKQRPTRKLVGGSRGTVEQALMMIAGYDMFQGTPCDAILGCVNVILMAVSVATLAHEFQRAYRASSAASATSAPGRSSVLGRIQSAASEALASETVANSIASPLRFLAAQLAPRGLVGFDQMFDTLNTAVRRMVSLLTLNMVLEDGMPATGIGAIAVGILRWQINTQLHLRFVETPLACTLMESGVLSCRERCLGMGSMVPEASHEGL